MTLKTMYKVWLILKSINVCSQFKAILIETRFSKDQLAPKVFLFSLIKTSSCILGLETGTQYGKLAGLSNLLNVVHLEKLHKKTSISTIYTGQISTFYRVTGMFSKRFFSLLRKTSQGDWLSVKNTTSLVGSSVISELMGQVFFYATFTSGSERCSQATTSHKKYM